MEEKVNKEQVSQTVFQEPLSGAGTVLTLGILSMLFCCCGPISLPLGIIAWVRGNKERALYRENPALYTESSYSNLNAGRVCGIVGVVLSVLFLIYIITSTWFSIQSLGGWDAYLEMIKEAADQY